MSNSPEEVIFCKKCVVSNQRPRIVFDENGVCSACLFAYQKQRVIDWKDREQQLQELCDKYRRNDGRYDIVVPASGGKDSAYVAHMLKHKYGMHPLTITWAPFAYTEIGWQNLQDFVASGFTNLLGWPNRKLHRKLSRIAFESAGDSFLPFTFGQMAYAFRLAMSFDIKLVFYGENGEAEYGGSTEHNNRAFMPLQDFSRLYWVGKTIHSLIDWGKSHGILTYDDYDESDLLFYAPPSVEELEGKGVQMHWFSYYHKWVPQENYYYAAEHTGFTVNDEGRSEGTYSKYASLDDKLDGPHYYMAYIKFGIGRATSDAAHEIRDGHITREEGVALVNRYDGEFPSTHHQEFLDYLDITKEKFHEVVDSYRPTHLWDKVDGEWQLKTHVTDIPAEEVATTPPILRPPTE